MFQLSEGDYYIVCWLTITTDPNSVDLINALNKIGEKNPSHDIQQEIKGNKYTITCMLSFMIVSVSVDNVSYFYFTTCRLCSNWLLQKHICQTVKSESEWVLHCICCHVLYVTSCYRNQLTISCWSITGFYRDITASPAGQHVTEPTMSSPSAMVMLHLNTELVLPLLFWAVCMMLTLRKLVLQSGVWFFEEDDKKRVEKRRDLRSERGRDKNNTSYSAFKNTGESLSWLYFDNSYIYSCASGVSALC